MSKGQTLQDPYLNALRKERVQVSIYLVNGIKLQGQIESFDQFVVLLKNLYRRWFTSTPSQQLFPPATFVSRSLRTRKRLPNIDRQRVAVTRVVNVNVL